LPEKFIYGKIRIPTIERFIAWKAIVFLRAVRKGNFMAKSGASDLKILFRWVNSIIHFHKPVLMPLRVHHNGES